MRKRPGLRLLAAVGMTAALAVGTSVGNAAVADPGRVAVTGTETNAEPSPLGIDDQAPRLRWALTSTKRAVLQTGFRVLVASTPGRLREGRADVWDSGRRHTAEPSATYAGRAGDGMA